MKLTLSLLLSLLLPPTAGAISPSITINEAVGASIYTPGQAPRTVNVNWTAGTDYTYCEVYYTINDANQTELARGHDGTKQLTVMPGNAYHFWMVTYPGGGLTKIVTELRVVAEQGVVPAPSSAPAKASDQRDGSVSAAGDAAAERVLRVAIHNVRIESGARHFIMRFNGQPHQKPYVAIGQGPATRRNSEWVFENNLVGGGFVGAGTVTDAEKAKGQYMFASAFGTTFSEEGLQPGGTYYYIITIPGPDPHPFQETGTFSMLNEKTTVSIVWERVLVLDDSDDLSTGEITFRFWQNHGKTSGKVFDKLIRDADSGHGYDLNRTVVIEDAPNTLSLSASGFDDDGGVTSRFDSDDNEPFRSAYGDATSDQNDAEGEFDLTQSPGINVRVPFALNAIAGGSLNYTVFGHLEITRTAGLGSIGTTSSPLKTSPAPEAIRPPRRVTQPDGTIKKSTLTICEAAKQARARNSPAAQGLEAKCLAEQKQ